MARDRRHPRRRNQLGASLVEFTFVVPVLVLLVFGTIDFGHAYSQWIEMRSGAREGARIGVVNGATSGADLITKTAQRVGLSSPPLAVAVQLENTNGNATTGDVGDNLVVCLRYPLRSLSGVMAPFLNGTLTAKAVMRMEQTASFTSDRSSNWPAGVQCSS
jgi:Flp pilus assembly protein TadG